MECSFCSDPNVAARTIMRNDLVWAVPTFKPIVPMHLLVMPVRHAETIDALTSEEWLALREMAVKLTAVLNEQFGAEGFNFAWNHGEDGGQSVPHFHLHILPRKKGDEGIYQYDPRRFLYRTEVRSLTPEEELRQVAADIKNALT
jgi:diadenosine tetraphosphate (Ap4A) HIT family hydrolase